MKSILAFLFSTVIVLSLYSQQKPCKTPIAAQSFQQKYIQIKNQQNDKKKLLIAKQLVRTDCFSSAQVKEIAALFQNDTERLDFAKSAFNSVVDKENFYDVYDAFVYYSMVFRLHEYVQNNSGSSISENIEMESVNIEFPSYIYPDFKKYRGQRNCNQLITELEFNKIAQLIYSSDKQQKLEIGVEQVNNKCFPVEYLMKIGSLLSSDYEKIEFSKIAIQNVYDIDQFIEMKQLFNSPRGQSEFMDILNDTPVQNNNFAECMVSQDEYEKIISTIKNEAFNSNKVSTAKHIIQTKKCLTSLQIKGVVDLFDYENSKLEIAMMAYEYVVNKGDYYMTVSESLGFESSKKRLLDYIKNQDR